MAIGDIVTVEETGIADDGIFTVQPPAGETWMLRELYMTDGADKRALVGLTDGSTAPLYLESRDMRVSITSKAGWGGPGCRPFPIDNSVYLQVSNESGATNSFVMSFQVVATSAGPGSAVGGVGSLSSGASQTITVPAGEQWKIINAGGTTDTNNTPDNEQWDMYRTVGGTEVPVSINAVGSRGNPIIGGYAREDGVNSAESPPMFLEGGQSFKLVNGTAGVAEYAWTGIRLE